MLLNTRKLLIVISIGVASGLTACGGGSDSEDVSGIPAPEPESTNAINGGTSLVRRQADLWIDYQGFRNQFGDDPEGFALAVSYADFDGDGRTDVFIAPGTSLYDSVPLEFYKNIGDGVFKLVTESWINGEIPEPPHSRKSIVADLNADGQPDIVLADHGPELEPGLDFPGGHLWALLSQSDGTYTASKITTKAGFYHAVAAGDLTGDGLPDLFVTSAPNDDPEAGLAFVNQGDGRLVQPTENITPDAPSLGAIYTTEIYDIDKDGYADIVVGGHEQDGADTQILWGHPEASYSLERSTVLPRVNGWGTVLDIGIADLDGSGLNDLVITRTGGGNNNFYEGYYIQVIKQRAEDGDTDARSFTDETDNAMNGPQSDAGAEWIPWIRLQDVSGNGRPDILADDKHYCLRWDNDGIGQFNLMVDACSL